MVDRERSFIQLGKKLSAQGRKQKAAHQEECHCAEGHWNTMPDDELFANPARVWSTLTGHVDGNGSGRETSLPTPVRTW